MKIGISGKMFSGKDVIADYLCENHNFSKVLLAKELKRVAMSAFNCTYEEVYETKPNNVRKCLQELGRAGRSYDENIWVNLALSEIESNKIMYPNKSSVVSDVRYINEVTKLKEEGFILIRVVRPNILRQKHGTLSNDDSETELDNYDEFTYTIINDTTKEDLYKKIDNIMKELTTNK